MTDHQQESVASQAGTSGPAPYVDPALHPEHQHQHAHLHHTSYAEKGRKDELVYAKDASFEKGSVADPTPWDHNDKSQNEKDLEEGEDQHLSHRTWYRRVRKHLRPFVHAVIWLLFTG